MVFYAKNELFYGKWEILKDTEKGMQNCRNVSLKQEQMFKNYCTDWCQYDIIKLIIHSGSDHKEPAKSGGLFKLHSKYEPTGDQP